MLYVNQSRSAVPSKLRGKADVTPEEQKNHMGFKTRELES